MRVAEPGAGHWLTIDLESYDDSYFDKLGAFSEKHLTFMRLGVVISPILGAAIAASSSTNRPLFALLSATFTLAFIDCLLLASINNKKSLIAHALQAYTSIICAITNKLEELHDLDIRTPRLMIATYLTGHTGSILFNNVDTEEERNTKALNVANIILSTDDDINKLLEENSINLLAKQNEHLHTLKMLKELSKSKTELMPLVQRTKISLLASYLPSIFTTLAGSSGVLCTFLNSATIFGEPGSNILIPVFIILALFAHMYINLRVVLPNLNFKLNTFVRLLDENTPDNKAKIAFIINLLGNASAAEVRAIKDIPLESNNPPNVIRSVVKHIQTTHFDPSHENQSTVITALRRLEGKVDKLCDARRHDSAFPTSNNNDLDGTSQPVVRFIAAAHETKDTTASDAIRHQSTTRHRAGTREQRIARILGASPLTSPPQGPKHPTFSFANLAEALQGKPSSPVAPSSTEGATALTLPRIPSNHPQQPPPTGVSGLLSRLTSRHSSVNHLGSTAQLPNAPENTPDSVITVTAPLPGTAAPGRPRSLTAAGVTDIEAGAPTL